MLMSETRVIKKYPNRRLYDTVLSRYITLQDVRDLVSGQIDIKVTDQRSGQDITRAVMLQVIAEQELSDSARLSKPFLARLIGSYRTTAPGPTSVALEQCLDQYLAGVTRSADSS